jgi:two-component system OmpR family sensor kinase
VPVIAPEYRREQGRFSHSEFADQNVERMIPTSVAPMERESMQWYEPAHLAQLFSVTPVMVAYLDEHFTIRMASTPWCEWFEKSLDQVIGQNYAEVVGSEYFARQLRHLEGARFGTPAAFDSEQVDRMGFSRWCRINLSPSVALRRGDEPCGVLVVMTEFTLERARSELIAKQRERIFEQYRDQHRNEEVHAELEKTKTLLDWRTSMLTERNEMLQLLSHEIRQPLNNASAAMQATMKAIEDLHLVEATPASNALLRAEAVLSQVIGTLDNTLAAGTILAMGETALDLSDTDLPTLVRLVLADIAADIRHRIDVEWMTDTRTVRLHPTLMRLTLRNLLNNALAYSPADTQVRLRIAESEEPLALVIEVIDVGSGIPDELRPRLFEKGARGTNSRIRSGAGLGLFIVRSVTNLHHGSVEALPNEPIGTTMRLVLPQGLAD